ncbi:MAG: hypothetical protein EZS28_004665 [Streblomastix strix]|uniref:Uncharacterized protein n=1 Tax=Streblomastix strix TaxID=222440 RepID=A0A5J4WY64_9EUKA|nr:MAG: hypothetical protein EZS28_004665 [Streblomastix strix]
MDVGSGRNDPFKLPELSFEQSVAQSSEASFSYRSQTSLFSKSTSPNLSKSNLQIFQHDTHKGDVDAAIIVQDVLEGSINRIVAKNELLDIISKYDLVGYTTNSEIDSISPFTTPYCPSKIRNSSRFHEPYTCYNTVPSCGRLLNYLASQRPYTATEMER